LPAWMGVLDGIHGVTNSPEGRPSGLDGEAKVPPAPPL